MPWHRLRLDSAFESTLRAPWGALESRDGEIGAGQDLVHLEHVGPSEHLRRRPVLVSLGEVRTARPRHEIVEAAPPGLDLVVALAVRIVGPRTSLVIELHRPGSMHLVAHEPGMPIDEVHSAPEAILEVDLVSACDGDAVRDDDHGSRVRGPALPNQDGTCR